MLQGGSPSLWDATFWTADPYPATNTIIYKNEDALVEYTFGEKRTFHGFCGICGVAIWERFAGVGRDHEMALNVRTMNGLNLAALKIRKHDGKLLPPLYELDKQQQS
ncbi:hypothetical protein C8R44DRAFT_730649 [Mycena epipterygia]|nr:hypothetical protein C8R44DRAFT_730649 [Mycena epipterygia]